MFGLSFDFSVLLILFLLIACAFEFINGFHDTANAVATVIYTNTLKPRAAVIWSGIWNFVGVNIGGIGVAIGIVNLIPLDILVNSDIHMAIALILSLVLTAILWNAGTWYYGIPCSSSHSLIGSIFGVGLAYWLMKGTSTAVTLPWKKIGDTGMALLFSPIFGFVLALLLMKLLKMVVRKKSIFKSPKEKKKPPFWIRTILLSTCTLVSFSHGSNDGQKGVGLIMIILIGLVPAHFALDHSQNPEKLRNNFFTIERYITQVDTVSLAAANRTKLVSIKKEVDDLENKLESVTDFRNLDAKGSFGIRKDILKVGKDVKTVLADPSMTGINKYQKMIIQEEVDKAKGFTEYAPWWVMLMISLSLGLGTMVGWKRIVVTIGEKIGKSHLSYAQGATAEIIAASTIAASSYAGLPVSTTHVLSSGVAGSMVAEDGVKNLQMNTIKNIGIAWVVTVPVTVIGSGLLFFFFNWLFGLAA
jgi:PiT family inorganic phosphate transporter